MRQPDPQSSRAVLIGTAHYEHQPDLPTVARNLVGLRQELIQPEVWGLPPQHCTVVEDPQNADEMLDPVYTAAQEARDVLLVYFSGHAVPGRNADLRLALPKTPLDRAREHYKSVSYDDLRVMVRDSRARYRIVILDCCYSGTAINTLGPDDMFRQTGIDGSYTITSSEATRPSIAEGNGEYTAFTEELITVMREGILGGGKYLTLDEIYDYVLEQLVSKELPRPERQDRNDAGKLALIRNRSCAGADTPPGYGEIPGVQEGTLFASRKDLHNARVHRPLQAGICGSEKSGGAESIVVSGGYPDDEDHGDVIIYTGHGGQDEKTKRQVRDQRATDPGNAALLASITTRYPVRVIRGAAGDPRYSPPAGFSYDGLYTVESHWFKKGVEGFQVIQFRLEKLHDNAPPVVPADFPVDRAGVNISRWGPVGLGTYQDRRIADRVRQAHNYECQICGVILQTPSGFRITPTVHLRSLAIPHRGPDVPANILCVCPTHRDQLNLGMITIDDDLRVIDEITGDPIGHLHVNGKHRVGHEYLRYHRELYRRR
ncbi:caspase, EACC1-associated type [Actinomadura kijaniata]|uniref:caspase, EACC1-associated type n=1 Tax=Actinomadura kijaniata TaxID=46161 RepID=UPI003F1AF7EC